MVSPYLRKYQNTRENSRGTWPRTVVCLRWLTVNLLWLYLSDKWPPDKLVNVKLTWLTEVGIAIKCKRVWWVSISYSATILLSYSHEWVLGPLNCYIRHRSVVFISRSAVERFNYKRPLYSVCCSMCMGTVCVEAERKNAKLNNRTWLNRLLTIREYQNFLPYYNIKKVLKC